MSIALAHLEALKTLGYTDAEACFLYIAATYSGYFVTRQLLAFTAAHSGQHTPTFWNTFHPKTQARRQCFPKSGTVNYLFSRWLYFQIARENIRDRRGREIEHIQRRTGLLDFVLWHPQWNYPETKPEKFSSFCDQLRVPNHFPPLNIYHGQRPSQPTACYFVDKFPMCFGNESSYPVVTFTCLQGPQASLTEFLHHLEPHLPLFRRLSEFRFLYLASVDSHFQKAKELFDSLVTIPLGSDVSADLLRYFQICKAWDLSRYTFLTEADLIFRNQAKTRFAGQRFEHLYRGWKVGRVSESDIRQDFSGSQRRATVHFGVEVLCRIAVPEKEPEAKG
jgi:hypothetical protein